MISFLLVVWPCYKYACCNLILLMNLKRVYQKSCPQEINSQIWMGNINSTRDHINKGHVRHAIDSGG